MFQLTIKLPLVLPAHLSVMLIACLKVEEFLQNLIRLVVIHPLFLVPLGFITASPGKHSADPKTRKRKKVSVSEDLDQISLLAQTQSESMFTPVVSSHLPIKVPVGGDIGQISLLAQGWTKSFCAPFVTGHFSTAVAVTAPSCFVSKSSSAKSLTAVAPVASAYHPRIGDHNVENGVIITEEPFTNVEDAKLQAEDAVTHAAAAVSQCEGVWSQLVKQKNSGLSSDVEAKLASAAVAIAAAASVSKAAAAAAKIASNAAIQAKLMADEALVAIGTGNAPESNSISHPDVTKNLGKPTPSYVSQARGRGVMLWHPPRKNKRDGGNAVASINCKIEWFHYGCVALKEQPKGKWYCSNCVGVKNRRKSK